MKKILLVEDDHTLGPSIRDTLVREGLDVTLATNLEQARQFNASNFDVILLDWMLPDGQGIDLLREVRNRGQETPIIMLTARTDLIDKVLGLESGANDYITKPFEPRELIARVRVQMRWRKDIPKPATTISVAELVMDQENRTCKYRGKEIMLTKMEFDLLYLLASHPGQTFSREKLLDKVWGLENYPTTRTVDTHVLGLRQKLDNSDLIETVRGIGYRFNSND